jgi:hypothetical protein
VVRGLVEDPQVAAATLIVEQLDKGKE